MHPLLIVLLSILGIVVLFFLMLTIAWLMVDTQKKYQDESPVYRKLLNLSTAILLFFCRVRVHAEGIVEQLPDEPFVLVSNHRSNFDPLVTWLALAQKKLIFISKPSNFRIPWFGRFIHRLRFLPIDRSNIAASRKTFIEAGKLITESGASIAVYPEGTRSKSVSMLPFHSAVFIMPYRAKVPVAVITIEGTEAIHRRFPRKTDVTLRLREVIPASWIEEHSMQELSDRAEADMRTGLNLPAAEAE